MASVIRLVTIAEASGSADVSVSARHEAELDDGSRVLLLDDRGWSSTQPWATLSPENAERTARMVVGPDEPYGDLSQADMETGHWTHLQQILFRHGVVVDVVELRSLAHDVLLGPALLARARPDVAR